MCWVGKCHYQRSLRPESFAVVEGCGCSQTLVSSLCQLNICVLHSSSFSDAVSIGWLQVGLTAMHRLKAGCQVVGVGEWASWLCWDSHSLSQLGSLVCVTRVCIPTYVRVYTYVRTCVYTYMLVSGERLTLYCA